MRSEIKGVSIKEAAISERIFNPKVENTSEVIANMFGRKCKINILIAY